MCVKTASNVQLKKLIMQLMQLKNLLAWQLYLLQLKVYRISAEDSRGPSLTWRNPAKQ